MMLLLIILSIILEQSQTFLMHNSMNKNKVHQIDKSNYHLRSTTELYVKRKKKKKPIPLVPEFSRILNTAQVPSNRPVLCRLLARDKEREGLADR